MASPKGTSSGLRSKGGQSLTIGFATKGPAVNGSFLTRSKLKKAGGSLVLTVPAAARNMLGLSEGQEMIVSVDGTRVIAEPVSPPQIRMKTRRPKYTLDELVKGCNPDLPLSEEERAWMDAQPVGNETW